jgi:single-strand DNA-binding protein
MKSMNKVFLMGHLGATPELSTAKGGKFYTRLRVATNTVWYDAADQKQERTDWHSVFVWGSLAQQCCAMLKKGALVMVEGSLSYWQVAQIDKEYKNAIRAQSVRFLTLGKSIETAPGFMETADDTPDEMENLDNPATARNHNAVAHPA